MAPRTVMNRKLQRLKYLILDSFSADVQGEGKQISEWEWNVSAIEPGVFFANVKVSGINGIESTIIKIAVIE